MAQFTLADTFVPEIFSNYVLNESTKTNRLIQSGIITPSSSDELNIQLLQPGDYVTAPYINDLTGDPQTWDDTKDIDVNGLTTGTQRMFKFRQAQAFGATDISDMVSGAGALNTIGQRFSNYWNTVDEHQLLILLQGVLSNTDIATTKMYDETVKAPSNTFGAAGFLGAISLMGDLQDTSFNKILVNSATYANMKLLNMIDTIQPSNAVTPINVYNGMQIVVDDEIPVNEDGTTTSYIAMTGAVQYAVALPTNASETEREARSKGGMTNVINRRVVSMHVNGTSVAKDFVPAGQTVTVEELGNGKTWASITDPRNIKVVGYKAKLASQFIPSKPETPSETAGK